MSRLYVQSLAWHHIIDVLCPTLRRWHVHYTPSLGRIAYLSGRQTAKQHLKKLSVYSLLHLSSATLTSRSHLFWRQMRQALDWVQYLDNDKKMAPSDPSRMPVVHCKIIRHAMALLAWASCGPSSTSVHTSLATRARHPCNTLPLCLESILDIGYALL